MRFINVAMFLETMFVVFYDVRVEMGEPKSWMVYFMEHPQK